ncbi:hypothetical protein GCM10022393_41460 [Aquimarina addita]|uniref:Beta-lactamase-inhibitor-like PepSY-like domain-containing protein n=1 Tax=Aquimarina addita TaxID=870485 RepID=A0ABP6UU40_9FLAO
MISNWKVLLCSIYLLAQVVLIVSARFSSNRYFVWAPHDIQIEYILDVNSEQKTLNDKELTERYGLGTHGWFDLPPDHLIQFITEYERLYPAAKGDQISLKYRVNGKDWKFWSRSGTKINL